LSTFGINVTPVLVYAFRPVSYRDTTARILEDQLRFAKALGASAGERASD
jgi:hypothetical protein